MTSGRLVEYEGGGEETRSNPWLAELQQDMFVEVHPTDAGNAGIRYEEQVWVEGPEGGRIKVMAFVTPPRPPRRGVHALPLRRPLPGQGFARQIPGRGGAVCFRGIVQYRIYLWVRFGDGDAGDEGFFVSVEESVACWMLEKDGSYPL